MVMVMGDGKAREQVGFSGQFMGQLQRTADGLLTEYCTARLLAGGEQGLILLSC